MTFQPPHLSQMIEDVRLSVSTPEWSTSIFNLQDGFSRCIPTYDCKYIPTLTAIYIFPHAYIFTNNSSRAGCDSSSFLSGVSEFSIQRFPFPRSVAYQNWGAQPVLLFTYDSTEKSRMYTFPSGISAIWNTNTFVQNLNYGHPVYFQRR